MTGTSRIAIVLLAALAAALGIALVWMATMDDDGMMSGTTGSGMGTGFMGMMSAMGTMNTDAMQARMREVLGDSDYDAMLRHMAEHRAGMGMNYGPGAEGAMHRMMDGMMSQMGMFGPVTPSTTITPAATP
jgi:hypothetical protein